MTMQYQDYQEYLCHPLYRAIHSAVMERSRGRCERCNQRPPTEVHHLRYPIWGTFDTTTNLEAICHECHCEEHGTER